MSDLIYLAIILALMFVFIIVYNKQQRTIDRLNDRLMARDYREYVSLTQPRAAQEHPLRKPMSWHDDPGIELDEEGDV